MTAQIQKKKEPYEEIFQWGLREFEDLDEGYKRKKSYIILDVAEKLDKAGFEKSKISTAIINRYKRFIDASWVNKVLKDYPQYKDQKKVESVKSRRINPTKPAQTKDDGRPRLEIPAKVEPINKSLPSTEVRTVEGFENDGDPNISVDSPHNGAGDSKAAANQPTELSQTQPKSQMQEQSNYEDEIDRFDIDKVDTYPVEVLRGVVRELYDNNTQLLGRIRHWGSVNEDLRKESETLMKQLEIAKPFLELLSLLSPKGKDATLESVHDMLQEAKEGLRK